MVETEAIERAGPDAVPGWFWDFMILIAAGVIAAGVYSNALSGEFVLDDSLQITNNPLLRDSRHFWTALTSDIWAFRGSAGQVSSHYWRPALVLLWMGESRAFGLQPVGWHAVNILLHGAVLVVVYGLMRRLPVARPLAAAVVLIFAVHPVHVESVTWVSGSSDMLLAISIIGSLWFLLGAVSARGWLNWAGAVACYVGAVMSKETAVVFPALALLVAWLAAPPELGWRRRAVRAGAAAFPFAAVACAYLAARIMVLGTVGVGGNVSLGSTILTAPSIVAFYLRQSFLPVWIGPAYPLRQVTLANLGAVNFVLPVLVLAVTAIAFWWLARRDRVRLIGGAIWLLFLLPALNIGAFQGERLAHDRYLYLPVLGAIMFAVSVSAAGLGRVPRLAAAGTRAVNAACLAAAAMIAVPLGIKAYRYNNDWLTQLALGEAMVRSDPGSVMNHTLLATAHHEAGAYDEAIAEFDRALEIHDWYYAALFRARSLIEARRYDEAERALEELIAENEQDEEAYELLGDCLVRHGRLERAEAVFREAREHHPQFKCRFTSGLAMILEARGRREQALAELEAVRGGINDEYTAPATIGLFQLGMLYERLGRLEEARGALREYLAKSASFPDPAIQEARQKAERALRRLDR